jgi:hypothetical protein
MYAFIVKELEGISEDARATNQFLLQYHQLLKIRGHNRKQNQRAWQKESHN